MVLLSDVQDVRDAADEKDERGEGPSWGAAVGSG